MVQTCSSFDCTQRFCKYSNISFHRFPTATELRKKWIIATGRANFNPSQHAVLCSNHFKESDFLIFCGKRRLKANAVPSIFKFSQYQLKNEPIGMSIESQETSTSQNVLLGSDTESNEKMSSPKEDVAEESNIKDRKRPIPTYFGDFNESHLKDPEMAKKMWEAAKQRIELQKKKIKILGIKNSRLLKQVDKLKQLLQENVISAECIVMIQERS